MATVAKRELDILRARTLAEAAHREQRRAYKAWNKARKRRIAADRALLRIQVRQDG